MSNIFRNNAPRPTVPAGIQVDHKRLQRLRKKKMAMGHKRNDHENEQSHGMGGMKEMQNPCLNERRIVETKLL